MRLRYLVLGVASLALSLGFAGARVALAASSNLSHSYQTSTQIPTGSLVSLDQQNPKFVVPANSSNASRLLGVEVAGNQSLLAVNPAPGKVQVAINGVAGVLVSTLNGAIAAGDQVGVSPFNGVGMKAEPDSWVVGTAQSAFNAGSKGAVKRQVTNKQGTTRTVYVGFVRVGLSVGKSSQGGSSRLNGLQRFVKSMTGRDVSMVRIIVAFAVALVALVSLATLIYSSIYGGIISMGRNPLAKRAIYRALNSVIAMVVLIAVVATIVIALLLT